MIIGEEVKLIKKVPDVDAAQWIHLRERQDTRKGKLVDRLVLVEPADINNLLVLLHRVDGHRHVVVRLNYLLEVIAESALQQLCILVKKRE